MPTTLSKVAWLHQKRLHHQSKYRLSIWLALSTTLVLLPLLGAQPGQAQSVAFEGCKVGTVPVATLEDPSLNDLAVAVRNPATGYPEIRYNRAVAANIRYRTRLFFYAHECAHHVLGHTVGRGRAYPRATEQEADCWAIRQLYGSYFNNADLRVLQQDLTRLGRASRTHFGGAQRARNLNTCLRRR
ncbi:hypothetical protein [Leptolyngbya sp. FACHB-261]|uniref:hypothetical protein n=1 Tax=Leptolyngbya sp. FACHB-261 TaxID=2692806 RepID=UPI001683D8E5|nr:hypothetical protein [Leptolyngbya sp. FACHB-261]MBD2104539.1 hypothetical protein [Leptolyngbya sp. FACHB-261]